MVGMNAHVIAYGYAFGAAVLAFWLFLRYPRLGPRTLKGAFLTVGSAYGLLLVTGAATAAAQGAAGPVVALVGVYLPLLTFAFWAGLRLFQVALAATNGFRG
jgi:hypothetical protein